MAKSLSQMMPDAWPIFFKRRRPHAVQEQALPLIVKGESVLLSGPTASGKTEAAVAPLFQRHVSFKRDKLAVVYTAPTKALVNDLYYRLDSYLCTRMPGAVRRYTGDHHELKDPENVFLLIATPEALDSLQLMRPESLSGVRAVVIDEIHLLHGNSRGQQLRHVIQRIKQGSDHPEDKRDRFHTIGMTATLKDSQQVCSRWLGDRAKTIKAGDPRKIEMIYLSTSASNNGEIPAASAEVISGWLQETETPKILIFGNTRNSTQALAASLYEKLRLSRWPVHWHTGILTATERERIEDAMKNERFGVCIATSTLEVGIDIGDIDAVVLADPPFTINSFLQRIGRGNRRTGTCKVVALYSTDQEKVLYRALHYCATKGILDDTHDYDRASVRFQQILSFAWKGVSKDKKPLTFSNLAERTCTGNHDTVVDDMISTGALEDIRGALIPSGELMDQGEKRQIHTTISGAATLNMVDSSTGETLVSASGQDVSEGDLFIGGKLKQVVKNIDGTVSLENTGTKSTLSKLPATRGKKGLGRRIIWAIAEITGNNPSRWKYKEDKITTWGGADYNCLLCIILKHGGEASSLKFDEYGISGLIDNNKVTPDSILNSLETRFSIDSIQTSEVLRFIERSRWFSYLSPEKQWEESILSIPMLGFTEWLRTLSKQSSVAK